jgi:hypothetical protein|mmetsp:Transcript_43410/g.57474  ORF Transcript_43410/g.57474 Transcript_43410/m.57474 type:complete len:128 (+) Transcript_43410:888-1271(+)
MDTYDLMKAPEKTNDVYEGSLLEADPTTEFPVYGHFNTGYPFIGVDEHVASTMISELQHFRPDLSCDFDKEYNPMSVCYWRDSCSDELFGDAKLTFAFGSDATFNLPMKELLVNYTASGESCCGFAM